MLNRTIALSVTATIVIFSSGWAFGGTAIAERVRSGLVTAIASVGQNLFGYEIFGATIINPDILPDPGDIPGVQLDFADTSEVPILINVFQPPDPIEPSCLAYARRLSSGGAATLIIDDAILPGTFNVVEGIPFGQPPDPRRGDAVVLPPSG